MSTCLDAVWTKAVGICPDTGSRYDQPHDLHRAFACTPELCVKTRMKPVAIEVFIACQMDNEFRMFHLPSKGLKRLLCPKGPRHGRYRAKAICVGRAHQYAPRTFFETGVGEVEGSHLVCAPEISLLSDSSVNRKAFLL